MGSIQTRVQIVSKSGFRAQDIDLGPPNYFQDGDHRGPSTRLGIEAILGPRGERRRGRERKRQRGVYLLSLGPCVSYGDGRLADWSRSRARFETISHGFRGHVSRCSCRLLYWRHEKDRRG